MTVYSIVYYDGGVAGYCLHKTYKNLADAEKELEKVEQLIEDNEFGSDVKSAGVIEINCAAAE